MWAAVAIAGAVVAGSATAASVERNAGSGPELQAALDELVWAGVPGAILLVRDAHGTDRLTSGYSETTRKTPIRVGDRFRIGSLTKTFVAAVALQLAAEGRLSLEDSVEQWLPGLVPNGQAISIRQLLDMRSGIPDWYSDELEVRMSTDRRRTWKTAEALALVGPNRAPAGTSFEYADTNYNLLGLVIEHVRGRPMVDVLRDGVLRVDGTERLIYQPDEAPTDPIAMPGGESRAALEKGGGYLPSRSDASSVRSASSLSCR